MTYMSKRTEQQVSVEHLSVRVEELHFHLGDILPHGTNYSQDDNVTLKVILHFSDPYGRDKRRTIILPSTTIL